MKLFIPLPNCKLCSAAHTTLSICQSHMQACIYLYLLHSFPPFTVPMERPMKNRSFSLTSHQLRALTQLACTLLGFERTVRELVTNMTFVDFTGEAPCVKGTTHSLKIHTCVYTHQTCIQGCRSLRSCSLFGDFGSLINLQRSLYFAI